MNQALESSQAKKSEIQYFKDLASFSKRVEEVSGLSLDFGALANLSTNFVDHAPQHLILSISSQEGEPNDLLYLTQDKAFLFSQKVSSTQTYKGFKRVLPKPYGAATVLTFIALNAALDSYKRRLENLISSIRTLEQNFEPGKDRELNLEFERLNDKLEEFHELLLRLQERGYKQVQTRYISFDYSVLMAEAISLEGRCRRRSIVIKDLAREHEAQVTAELNKRIEKLNDVVKRLTALTVILMIPTLIASHFGMNFAYMPELKLPWAYPVVIASQIILVGIGFYVFKKIGWL